MKPILKITVASILSFVFLTACGKTAESPEKVIDNLKHALVQINSADITADITIKGSGEGEALDFNLKGGVKFDRSDPEVNSMELQLKANGTMSAMEKTVNGDFDFEMLALAGQYYLRLNKLDSTEESMNQIQLLLKDYMSKWLLISSDFIPDELKNVQVKDEEALAKEKQLKDLFVKTDLFSIVKEYGIESLDGKKVYHYGIELNKKGAEEYVRALAAIEGREVTDSDITEVSKMVAYLKGAQIWIGTDDYYPYKFTVAFDSTALDSNADKEKVDIQFTLALRGSDYNRKISIKAPENAQDFNPLDLLMNYGMMNAGNTLDSEGDSSLDQLTDAEKEEFMKALQEETADESLTESFIDDDVVTE